jgi:hypothetical protein
MPHEHRCLDQAGYCFTERFQAIRESEAYTPSQRAAQLKFVEEQARKSELKMVIDSVKEQRRLDAVLEEYTRSRGEKIAKLQREEVKSSALVDTSIKDLGTPEFEMVQNVLTVKQQVDAIQEGYFTPDGEFVKTGVSPKMKAIDPNFRWRQLNEEENEIEQKRKNDPTIREFSACESMNAKQTNHARFGNVHVRVLIGLSSLHAYD